MLGMLSAVLFCSATVEPVFEMAAGNATHIRVQVAQEFCLRLRGQISTGYSWQVAPKDSSPDVVILEIKPEAAPGAGKLLGGGESELWRCRVDSSGRLRLRLIYVRPWERPLNPARAHDFWIDARE